MYKRQPLFLDGFLVRCVELVDLRKHGGRDVERRIGVDQCRGVDVYKRQAEKRGRADLGHRTDPPYHGRCAVPLPSAAGRRDARADGAVSYTHLDVYKRQPISPMR